MTKSTLHVILLCVLMIGTVSCGPSLVIQNVDYSQPLESVLTPNSENMVHDQRYAIKFSVAPILEAEGTSSVNEVHLIRNHDGYYFVTAGGFQNVYVFAPGEGELELENTIEFVENPLEDPAFNRRDGYIELVDLSVDETYRLNHEGIIEPDTEEEDSE